MIVAIDSGSDIGERSTWTLLGDHRCDRIVMLNSGWLPKDERVSHSRDLTGVDVVVSDGTTPLNSLIGRASVAGVPLVVWADAPKSDLGPASIPVIVGANLGSTLAHALLSHPLAESSDGADVTVAWTEPGRPLRSGVAVAFPEPIGVMWATRRGEGCFVAYRDDEWAGAVATTNSSGIQRIVGVADHSAHLEALTLVAVAFVASRGAFPPGIQSSSHARGAVLKEVRNLELELAVWRGLGEEQGK